MALRIATLQGPVIIAMVNAPCISGQRKQLSESEGIAKNRVHSHMYDYSLGLNDASVSTVMSSLVLVCILAILDPERWKWGACSLTRQVNLLGKVGRHLKKDI